MYIPNGAGYVLAIAAIKRALMDDVLIVVNIEHHWPTVRMGVSLSRLSTVGRGLYFGVLCPELNATSLDVSISLLFTADHNQLVKYADPAGGAYRAACILTHAATGRNVTLGCTDVLRYTINGTSLQPGRAVHIVRRLACARQTHNAPLRWCPPALTCSHTPPHTHT